MEFHFRREGFTEERFSEKTIRLFAGFYISITILPAIQSISTLWFRVEKIESVKPTFSIHSVSTINKFKAQ